jgi:hypothetical protein
MVRKEVIITSAMFLLIIYTASLSAVSQVYPADQAVASFSNAGSIQIQTSPGIGVYSDYACYNELNTASWGTLEPGDSQNIVCYVKNEGNTDIILSLETSNWSPTVAASYLSLDWNYNGQTIAVDDRVQIILTLSVDSNVEGVTDFSFDVSIVAS